MGFSSIDCPNTSCHHYQGTDDSDDEWPPAASSTAVGSVPAGGVTVAANPALRVQIISHTPGKSWIEITFVAHGDPGTPNKRVEFLWSLPNQSNLVICTLSSRNTYYVAGVDADGQTVYTTLWQCVLDGVQPAAPYSLDARIN